VLTWLDSMGIAKETESEKNKMQNCGDLRRFW